MEEEERDMNDETKPMTVSDVLNEGVKKTGWEPGGVHVAEAARSLTKAERRHVLAGYVGDCSMPVLRSLRNKAMFYLKIDSPNGRCGIMVLTPLGRNVQALLRERAAKATAGETRNAEPIHRRDGDEG